MLRLGLNERLDTGHIIGPYPNFDQLYDQYREGTFGEPGQEAGSTMLETWSRRCQVPLKAGATALTGEYEVLSAQYAIETKEFDAAVAARHETGTP